MAARSNLTSAKEARKRAELDAQLLANRIALLKQEEERAWKKIEETRKRAGEIIDLRTVNEDKFQAKEEYYREKWENIRSTQSQNSDTREKAKAARTATVQEVRENKKKIVVDVREQSQNCLAIKKEREQQAVQSNIERSEIMRREKAEAKARTEREQQERLQKYRQDYENRVSQEEMLRSRTEALVSHMEKEELSLIQRLQNTQTVQRQAYEELETALGATAMVSSSSKSLGMMSSNASIMPGSAARGTTGGA